MDELRNPEDHRDKLAKLREAFPAGVVGLLPKPTRKDAPKGSCSVCGGYHGLPAVHLDFVGHAAVTDRLLNVDPLWSWEPFATDERGLPALDRDGNLWIRLTVCGVTRIGVGDGLSMKERIGDAIRNSAMRFGVALSLWTKDELESGNAEQKASEEGAPAVEAPTTRRQPPETGEGATDPQRQAIRAILRRLNVPDDREVRSEFLATLERSEGVTLLNRAIQSTGELTKREASEVIDALTKLQEAGYDYDREPR